MTKVSHGWVRPNLQWSNPIGKESNNFKQEWNLILAVCNQLKQLKKMLFTLGSTHFIAVENWFWMSVIWPVHEQTTNAANVRMLTEEWT